MRRSKMERRNESGDGFGEPTRRDADARVSGLKERGNAMKKRGKADTKNGNPERGSRNGHAETGAIERAIENHGITCVLMYAECELLHFTRLLTISSVLLVDIFALPSNFVIGFR